VLQSCELKEECNWTLVTLRMGGQVVLSLQQGEVCSLSPVLCELVVLVTTTHFATMLAGKGQLVIELYAMGQNGLEAPVTQQGSSMMMQLVAIPFPLAPFLSIPELSS